MRKALLSVPGVRTAQISLKNKEAVVSYDPSKAKPAELLDAIKKAGFGAKLR